MLCSEKSESFNEMMSMYNTSSSIIPQTAPLCKKLSKYIYDKSKNFPEIFPKMSVRFLQKADGYGILEKKKGEKRMKDESRATARAQTLSKMGLSLYWYETVDSTNSEAKRRAPTLPLPAVLVADAQTAGRGRMGRSFYSPRETGLYFSYLTDRLTPADTVGLTAAAAVAAARAIARVTGIEIEIKWVNDLLIGGK